MASRRLGGIEGTTAFEILRSWSRNEVREPCQRNDPLLSTQSWMCFPNEVFRCRCMVPIAGWRAGVFRANGEERPASSANTTPSTSASRTCHRTLTEEPVPDSRAIAAGKPELVRMEMEEHRFTRGEARKRPSALESSLYAPCVGDWASPAHTYQERTIFGSSEFPNPPTAGRYVAATPAGPMLTGRAAGGALTPIGEQSRPHQWARVED